MLLSFLMLVVTTTETAAQSGTAFRDFDGNGTKSATEPGVEGIVVKLYANATLPAKDQLIGMALTNASGVFNFATNLASGRAANPGELVRVEFEIPNSFECSLANDVDFEGLAGAVFGSSVQFITGQQANLRFAINYPGQWVQDPNPDIFLPCYAFGDPFAPGNNVANDPAFVTYKFLQSGIPANHSNGQPGVPGASMLSSVSEVGSLYGTAFSRSAQLLFSSAVIRRHCGLGPLGPGGIYLIDPNEPSANKTTNFLDLDAIGIHTWDHNETAYPPNPGNNTSPVTGFVGTNAQRGLPGDRFQPSTDYASGDQVGKVSIGDIDISDDGRYLYVMNLWDRRIYEIDLVNPLNPQAPTLANVADRVRSWPVPDPGTNASQGEHRPWGLKYFRGKIYVGIVLSGQNLAGNVVSPIINGNGAELRGYVYEFNPGTQAFSAPLLNFSFNYGRERPWIPWGYSTVSGLSRYFSGPEREIAEPIIADIEFDDEGNMLIGILDRKGHQYAINTNNYAGNLVNYEYSTAGELLRANAAVVNGECVYSIITRPGTTDYYNDNLFHVESVQGPLAVLPGRGEAVAVWLDPIAIRSGGTIRLNNNTGAQVPNSAFEVFDDRFTLGQPGATASKANGLGDVELGGENAPVEIGNRVWADFDGDGIQDSGEPGIPGVEVQLKTPGGILLATVTTNANGIYFFNHTNVPDGDPNTPGNQPGPLPYTDYKICIPAAEFGNGQPLNNALVTPPDQLGTGLQDYSDSDGILLGNGDVQIMLTTNAPGENNNTYDFGIIPADFGDLPDTYGTTEGNNGPWHSVSTSLKLGNCVDAEIDGQPEAMAGQMTGGDDNNVGLALAGTCTGNGDDENGIVFETPMIPGAEACLRITAMNMSANPAVLQGWIDFNGNGTFEAGEALTTGDFAPAGAVIPAGGVSAQLFCFTVPATATFQGGQAFSRFRLSENGGLGTGGGGGFGEVEDYKTTLAKIGNLVWNDYNNDGIQNEPLTAGINGVNVQLEWAGPDANFNTTDDNRTYTTLTATAAGTNGKYDFCGLIAGTYRVSVPVSPAGLPTLLNVSSDVTDSDDPAGVLVNIPANFSLPTGENGMGDNPGGTNGFPDSRDNLTFDFGYVGLDYGDLPDTYGTTEGNEGPAHVVTPDLYLGTCVDGEQDGQPEAMAGLMTAGDDGNVGNGTQGTCSPAGDDENGIVFETPMVPGSIACIRVTAHNTTGDEAYLQGWVDFNGNGTFDASEALNTLDFVGDGAVVPNGGVVNAQYCFNVPAAATFTGGQAMVRFRLSPDGDLQSGNPTGSTPPLGEVEDYKAPLSKVGNLVWWDVNNNGQQDAGENGLNNVTVQLTWLGPDGVVGGGDDVTYTTNTSNMGTDGMYMFLGLTPGMYKLNIPTAPVGFSPTLLNVGNDVTDSDDPAGEMVVIPNPPTTLPTGENGIGDNPNDPNFPDNQNDLTYDFGFVALDYGDLPDAYGTTIGTGGPAHLLDQNLYLGTCVDGETNGQPEAMAGLMTGGDDNNSNPVARLGACSDGDDENGVVLFETPLIPGYTACIRVTAVNTTGSNAVLQAWIDFNGNGSFDLGEQLTTGNFAPSGASIPNGGVVNQLMCFEVPANATFNGGQAMARFRLSPNGGLTPGGPAAGPYPIGEVEDYKVAVAKIGTYVWNDNNNDGIQNEPGTNGLNGVTVQMVWGGPDGDVNTLGDNRTYVTTTAPMGGNDGQYMFWGLIPGAYKVSVPTNPVGFVPTQLNLGGNENQDADDNTGEMVMIPALPGLPTNENGTGDTPGGFNGFPDAQDNLQIDFGFVALDYGDLPDTYGTTDGSPADGPVHTINPAIKLGTRVDSDPDGQPDPMAGLMSGGDDNNNGGYNEGGAGDDEDGIVFESPMVPGNQACIRVTAMNMFAAPAVLQMWIDFNGDGDVADPGEAVTTGVFNGAGGGAAVPVGGLNNAQLCFDVPSTATFTGGNAFARFRISTTGNLSPNGPENMPFPMGEVEDYKLPLSKIGNYVWNDNNNDGIQNEPLINGLNGVNVQLVWFGPDGLQGGGDDVIYTVTTSNMGIDGQYMFLGLTPGMYKLSVPTNPAGFIPTQLNQGVNDVIDAEDPAGTMVAIPNPPTTLPTGENGTGDVPNDPNFPDNQNDLTYDFGFVSVDYGDLPNTYGTDIASNGPKHIVNPNLKLGVSVDGELNGQPEAMAGFMSGGDDNNQGGYNEGGAGDDENGIVFKTPMIPGFEACLSVTTMNTTGSDARLQIWIDFNGDGDVNDAGELLNTGAFAPAAGALITGGMQVQDYCFTVPASATFAGGAAFLRARISPNGGLPVGGPANMPYPIGEVEDYKIPVAKAGNLVWIDANANGIQDENVNLGIDNVTVQLVWAGPDGIIQTPQNALVPAGDDRIYTDVTATEAGVKGKYLFCGLTPNQNFQMRVPPFGYVPTLVINVNGNTQDVIDADQPLGVAFSTNNLAPGNMPTGEFGTGDAPNVIAAYPDNQINQTFDFGYLGFDFGDLPETYATTQAASGAVHTVTPDLYLGTCVDVDIDGQPEAMAGFMSGGDDGNAGPGSLGICSPLADDENGISFPTPLIPGNQACVKVTARNVTGGAAFLQAWIDFNGNGTFEINEQLTTGNFSPAGASIPNGGVTNQNFCFDVPASATFNGGNLFARFRLSQNGGVNATGPAIPGNGQFPNGEVEDYKLPLALIGNYVWMDNPDIEGDQDATEMPLENVKINLIWAGEDGIFQTAANSATPSGDDRVYMNTTNALGRYEFRGMIPSTNYRILAEKYTAPNGVAGALINPVNKILTIPNLPANDNIDSDGTPLINVSIPNLTNAFLPTAENGLQDGTPTGFPDNQTNVSLDLGFIDEPKINAAMAIVGFVPTNCGEFGAIMDLCIKNTSTAPLASLQAMLDLAGANAYGAAFRGVIAAPIIVSSTAQQDPVLNAAYSGATTAPGKNLFNGTSGLLWPGEQICIRVTFGVDPDAPGAPAFPKAQAMVSGRAQNFQGVPIPDYWNGGAQYVANDLSDAGTDPMSTNPGAVGDTGGSDDPTPLGNCWQTTQNMVCNDLVYVSVDNDCSALVTPSMFLEGEDPNCDEDNYPLGGFFEITITTLNTNQPVPNPIPASYFGQTLKYSVRHIMSCNSCWGNLKMEDKLQPEIECSDINLNCAITNYTPDYLQNVLGLPNAYPEVFDCANYNLTHSDTWHDVLCNESVNGQADISAYVERIWTATDSWGNSSTCVQYIYFDRIHVFDITFPIETEVSCTNGNAHPSITGVPYYEAFGIQWPLWPNAGFCELATSYTDDPIVQCDGTTKILRTWKAIDWCLPTSPTPPLFNPLYYIQLVKVVDNQGPAMVCPADVTVSTDPFACCATTNLPDIIMEDNCSRINNIEAKITTFEFYTGEQTGIHTVGGTLQDFPGNNWWDLDTLANYGWTPCLPVGTHRVMYTAQDDCGNTATCVFNLTVQDLVPPVAACDETTTVAIGPDDPFDCYTATDDCEFAGVTYVKASTFNDGSYDNCFDVKFTVRRMAPYSDCINGLNQDPCYPNGWSEFELATAELDSIKFYCCEVGTTQTIVLTVYQVDVNGNLMLGADGEPVRNECMIQVEVQDKLRPVCLPPAQVNVNCENFDPSLWAYGNAQVADNCCLDTSRVYQGQCGLTHTANYALFDTVCNKGTITRTFRAFDCHGQSSQCTQRVIVTYKQDYFVRFPNDVIVTQCDGTGVYGEPTFFGEDCELLAVSFTDEIFTVVPDACFKIERTWKIINWCTFDPNQPTIQVPNPNPNPISNNAANLPGPIVSPLGTLAPWAPTSVRINPTDPQPTNYSTFWEKNANGYEYKQIIKIIDGQAPTGTFVTPSCDNQNWLTANNSQLWNEMYWWDNGIQTHDLCEEPTDLCITGTDACSGSNINIEYLLFLDLDGDGVMETVVNSVNTGIAGLGWNNVLYNNLNTPNFSGGQARQFDERPVPANQKYGFSIQETVNGTNKTACVRWNTQQQQNNFVVPELPHGTHKIKWFITDGCGNNAEYEYTFTVKDCKAPTVVCLNGLSTNIMPTGMITLWASDFLQYTEDNCTPAGQIKIGIRKCGTGTGFPVDANGNPITNITFDCNELGQQCVELWAIDAQGNADYCETFLNVQDNIGSCGANGTISVSGALKTESLAGIEEAIVTVTPGAGVLTTTSGTYAAGLIPAGSNVTITPEKDDNPLNGVTTYDLVLISKHILGLEPLNSPYKMIAADANKSGSITTFDIVEIRKLILGIYTELPNNTSWRFLDKSFSFPNVTNPFQTAFPEVINIANATANQLDQDFVGVKVGDVNGTVVANATMTADDRTAGTAIFDVSPTKGSGDRNVKAGEIFELTFKATQDLQGFQFTMLHSGLELLEVVNTDGVNAQNFGQFEGKTTVSVDGAQAFTLQFRATKSGKLSEMLGVSGEITRAEAYAVTNHQSPITQSPISQSPITQSPITQSPITKLGIAFRFGGQTISGVGFELYQNQPNPFVNKTTIGFYLPEAAEATLSVFDGSGRMVYQQKGKFAKGENNVSLDRALLNTTGVLYYKLETATDSATKKMIQTK
jgi:hypothetical protein